MYNKNDVLKWWKFRVAWSAHVIMNKYRRTHARVHTHTHTHTHTLCGCFLNHWLLLSTSSTVLLTLLSFIFSFSCGCFLNHWLLLSTSSTVFDYYLHFCLWGFSFFPPPFPPLILFINKVLLCHNWLRHWSGTPYCPAPVHQCSWRALKSLDTNNTMKAT